MTSQINDPADYEPRWEPAWDHYLDALEAQHQANLGALASTMAMLGIPYIQTEPSSVHWLNGPWTPLPWCETDDLEC